MVVGSKLGIPHFFCGKKDIFLELVSFSFVQTFVFLDTTVDPASKKPVVRRLPSVQAVVDMKALLRLERCEGEEEYAKVLQPERNPPPCVSMEWLSGFQRRQADGS